MARWMAGAPRALAASAFGRTFRVAYQTRVTGLAAEASFWGIFALPWLILGLVSGVTAIQGILGVEALSSLRSNTLDLAQAVLTPQAIDQLLMPLLDSLLQGEGTVSLFGFALALYAGSRLIGTLTDGMAIVYRQEGIRSFVHARALSLGVYVVGLAGLIVVIPMLILGPRVLERIVPAVQSGVVSGLLIAGQLVLVLAALVSLYHLAAPRRTSWWSDVPGAILAMALFSLFSYLLRWYFTWLFREGSVYGAISAPIAVMWWVYVTNLAVLLGAAFNGTLAIQRGWYPAAAEDPPGPVLPVV